MATSPLAKESTVKWWKKSPSTTRKQIKKTVSDPNMQKISYSNDRPLSEQALPWTELSEGGSLYNTALKKVRYRSHTSGDFEEGDLSFKLWETIKIKQMKAATLEKLVEHLTPPTLEMTETDPGFLLVFLCTYKSFTSTTEVIDLLLKRFEDNEKMTSIPCDQENALGITKQICCVISIWIDQYPRDFDETPTYDNLNKLIQFTEERKHVSYVRELHTRCVNKYRTLSVSPFDDEKPFKFKFCSCVSIIGCTCEKSSSNSKYFSKSFELSDFADEIIAEQLTLVDSELFLRVVPRESLAYFWSKRDTSKGSQAQSIKLTVEQFNAVSLKVVSTILNAKDMKSKAYSSLARSRAIMKWIEIAAVAYRRWSPIRALQTNIARNKNPSSLYVKELREFKNFSSLKAILSALQSTAVYRLFASWELVPKCSKEIYDDLAEIFSSESNQKASRELLVQEGTAKYSTNSFRRTKSKRESWMKEGRTHGTVPYLGTFLTDLMMIDTAFPDRVQGGLLNFEKRRKEFEVVVQIKLLQEAAKNYSIPSNEDFFLWFNSVETYDDKGSYERSIEVEPPVPKTNDNNNVDFITPQPQRRNTSLRKYLSETDLFNMKHSKNLMEEDLDVDSLYTLVSRNHFKAQSLSCRTTLSPEDAVPLDETGVVARVYLQDAIDIQYKSIKILPNHKAKDVILATLHKFKSENDVIFYSLYQVLNHKKSLHIPMNSNMYYAMHKCKELCFKVAEKKLSKKAKKNAQTLLGTPIAEDRSCLLSNSTSTSSLSPEVLYHSFSPRSSSTRSSFTFQLTNEIATDDAIDGRIVSMRSITTL